MLFAQYAKKVVKVKLKFGTETEFWEISHDLIWNWESIQFYTPPLYSGRILWFHVEPLCICPSVHPYVCLSVRFSFPDDNSSKQLWIFTKFGMCIDIVEIWLGLLMGKFRQILTELPARDMPIFSFTDNNLSKRQWIFTKLGMCINMKEIWFWIANGQISSTFDKLSARDMIMAGYYSLTFLLSLYWKVRGCSDRPGVRLSVRPSGLTNVYLCVLKLWTLQCISMGFIP